MVDAKSLANEWIEHDGMSYPLAPGDVVMVRMRGGNECMEEFYEDMANSPRFKFEEGVVWEQHWLWATVSDLSVGIIFGIIPTHEWDAVAYKFIPGPAEEVSVEREVELELVG